MLQTFRLLASPWRRWLTLPIVVALVVVGCGPAATPTPAPATTAAPTLSPPTAAPSATSPPTATETAAAALLPCSSAVEVSMLQTPVPATPAPTATAPSATPTAAPPTATPRPAPKEDHVGFPEGYQSNFKLMFVYDRLNNRQVRIVCGNDVAASIQPGQPFPHGTILVMETWRAKQDADGNVVKDANGHFIREALTGMFVMRKEPGFGVDYQGLRTGEWEYVAYRADKSFLTPPEHTANCAACHVGATQKRDWIFRAHDLFFVMGRYAAAPAHGKDEIAMNSMTFFPRTLKVAAGTTLTWFNDDVVPHTVTANDGAVDSGVLDSGQSFSFTFNTAGTFAYHCSIHPEQMRAQIEVTG